MTLRSQPPDASLPDDGCHATAVTCGGAAREVRGARAAAPTARRATAARARDSAPFVKSRRARPAPGRDGGAAVLVQGLHALAVAPDLDEAIAAAGGDGLLVRGDAHGRDEGAVAVVLDRLRRARADDGHRVVEAAPDELLVVLALVLVGHDREADGPRRLQHDVLAVLPRDGHGRRASTEAAGAARDERARKSATDGSGAPASPHARAALRRRPPLPARPGRPPRREPAP